MNSKSFYFMMCFLVCFISLEVKAEAYLNPAFMYWTESYDRKSESSNNGQNYQSENRHSNLSVGLGIQTSDNVLFGLKYFKYSINGKGSEETFFNNEDTRISYSATGATVGYAYDAIIGQFSLMLLQAPLYEGGGETLEGGQGSIIDLGYFVKTNGISFGPQVSFVNFDFKKRTISGEEDDNFTSANHSFTLPYFACMFYF